MMMGVVKDVYISLTAQDETIEEILNQALRGTNLEYEIERNTILIKKAKSVPQQQGNTY